MTTDQTTVAVLVDSGAEVYVSRRSYGYTFTVNTAWTWEVGATWKDFHGATLTLSAEANTIREAAADVAAQRLVADRSVK